jgi:hypothetical protein
VILFRRNSHVVEDLTDWHAATGHLACRLVFSPPGMFPAADAPRFADLFSASDSRAVRQTQRPGVAAGLADDDQILARVLSTSRTLATGRTLRGGVRPQPRTEEELITFQAGNQTTVGCVVVTGPTSRRTAP